VKSPTPVNKILTSQRSTAGLRQLIGRLDTLRSLNARLQQLLPTPLAQYCSIASAERGQLVILVSSPAWATRLRLLHPKIIKAFNDLRIKSVTPQVLPENQQPARSRAGKRRPRLSQQSARLLIELAENTSDPKLKNALRRLSRHGQQA
jgi:hypothetical protein